MLAIETYIRQAAAARGINPDIAVRVARSEGGLSNPTQQSYAVKNGKRETSYGPFQLRIGGGIGDIALRQGVDPRKASDWQKGVDIALNHAARHGWGEWYGAAKVGVSKFAGITKASRPVAVSGNAAAYADANAGTPAEQAAADMAQGKQTPLGMGRGQIHSGPAVRELQSQLAAAGLYKGKVDGSYGPQTAAAVRAAETAYNLPRDKGVAGPQVQAALAGTGKTKDITDALALTPPGGPGGPDANPRDIAFGRASAQMPWDVTGPTVAARGRTDVGLGRGLDSRLAANIAPGGVPAYARGESEIAGRGGLTSGGPPSELAANPPVPLDAPGGPAWPSPIATGRMGYPGAGQPLATETAQFGPNLGKTVGKTGHSTPASPVTALWRDPEIGFGQPADFGLSVDLRSVPPTPLAEGLTPADTAVGTPAYYRAEKAAGMATRFHPQQAQAVRDRYASMGSPTAPVSPNPNQFGPDMALLSRLAQPMDTSLPARVPGGDPYAANRAYAAAHPPPTFFAGPGPGELSPPGDVPHFDTSRFASEPNAGGMPPISHGTSINDVLAGIGGIPAAWGNALSNLLGGGSEPSPASVPQNPAYVQPAVIPPNQGPELVGLPQQWGSIGGFGSVGSLVGNAGADRFGPAGGEPAPFTPGGAGYTTIDMNQVAPGVFDGGSAPLSLPVSAPAVRSQDAKQSAVTALARALSSGAGLSAPSRSGSGSTNPMPSYPGGYMHAGTTQWGSPQYYTGSSYSNSPFTPSGYTAPSFSQGSGGPTYAYHSNGDGTGTYVDSHGNVHSY